VPIFAGTILDRRSRRITIYMSDFIFTVIYGGIAALLYFNFFSYWVFLGIELVVGSLIAYYLVAYDSYYPNLIHGNNFSKAYAISSLMYPIASTIMVPLAGWAYEEIGTYQIFAFASITSFVTACIETRVKGKEPHLELSRLELDNKPHVLPFKQFGTDLKFGLNYLKKEKGLMTITLYFFFTMGTGAVLGTLFLPYLRTNIKDSGINIFGLSMVLNSTLIYSIIMGANTFGRMIGGTIHYIKKLPTNRKFAIALVVYIVLGTMDAIILFMPYWWIMVIFQFIEGVLAVTSFNIRISGTQNYVPDNIRARFNGTFTLLTMAGSMIGQLISGALGERFDVRYIVLISMAINMAAIFLIMFRRRKYVKPIYNCDI
jgi:MFS family permease